VTGKEHDFLALKEAWQNCQRCPLASLRQRVVFGTGPLDAKVMMIGEAPGKEEDLGGEPFIGPAGKKFDGILEEVGLDRKALWITNTCLCRPVSTVEGKENRAPLVGEIKACSPRLAQEIGIVRPEIIVVCGNTPLFAFTGLKSITKHRGWHPTSEGMPKLYATLHPASLLYGSAEQKQLKYQWLLEDWLNIRRSLGA
jgi:uracil-DNA glycosylase family 4